MEKRKNEEKYKRTKETENTKEKHTENHNSTPKIKERKKDATQEVT